MSEQTTDVVQVVPVYVGYEATTLMAGAAILAVNHLLGDLVAAITDSLEATESVRLCVATLHTAATIHLPLTDLDKSVTAPQAELTGVGTMEASAFESLRSEIDHDWEQLRADPLQRHRPVLVLITQGRPPAKIQEWSAVLHAPERVIVDTDVAARVWPPQLVVIGVGAATERDLRVLAAGEDDVVGLATDDTNRTRTSDLLRDVLLDRVAHGGDRLLRRWAVACHTLGTVTQIDTRGDREVLVTQVPHFDGVRGPVRFLRYVTPRALGDGIRGVLRATALQDSDLPGLLVQEGIELTWPVRLVLDDSNNGTIVGVLEEEQPGPHTQRRTIPVADLTTACGTLLGPGQVDSVLTLVENGILFTLRACRSLAVLLDTLHSRNVVLDKGINDVRVDTDTMRLSVDRMDLATIVRPGDEDEAAQRWADLRRLAEIAGEVLGPQPNGIPTVLDRYGDGMVALARAGGAVRPASAREWLNYLDQRIERVVGLPRVVHANAAPDIVPVGKKVTLMWHTHFADSLVIHLPDGQSISVPAGEVSAGTTEVRLTVSGWIRLEARNRLGPTEQAFPWVHLFDPVDLLNRTSIKAGNPLQVVALPPMPVLPQPSGAADLPPYPQVLAHAAAIESGLAVLRGAADGLQVIMNASRGPAHTGAADPRLPDPLDPVPWFTTSLAPPTGRSRRRKG